jgi:HSP20 family protein
MHEDRFFELARRWRPGRFNPNTDVFLDAESRRVVVQVELAGADPESLTVCADETSLYISGHRFDYSAEACRTLSILQKEIEYGEFAARIPLPGPTDVDEANATYNDGILTITLPLMAREPHALRTELRVTVRKITTT